jgi:hypothetical protein
MMADKKSHLLSSRYLYYCRQDGNASCSVPQMCWAAKFYPDNRPLIPIIYWYGADACCSREEHRHVGNPTSLLDHDSSSCPNLPSRRQTPFGTSSFSPMAGAFYVYTYLTCTLGMRPVWSNTCRRLQSPVCLLGGCEVT